MTNDTIERDATIFYTNIAAHYDAIFPPSAARVEAVNAYLPPPPGRVLDLGCATGHFAIGLAARGHTVRGIDLDPALVKLARENAYGEGEDVRFEVLDMLAAAAAAEASTENLATCFGNTLVHLEDPAAVTRLCRDLHRLLLPGGAFIGQIINYDRILDEEAEGLSTIDNEQVRFERRYPSRTADGRLVFATTLTLKATDEVLENEILLYPLRRAELETCFADGGFSSWSFYAGIDERPWVPGTHATFFAARKDG